MWWKKSVCFYIQINRVLMTFYLIILDNRNCTCSRLKLRQVQGDTEAYFFPASHNTQEAVWAQSEIPGPSKLNFSTWLRLGHSKLRGRDRLQYPAGTDFSNLLNCPSTDNLVCLLCQWLESAELSRSTTY